MSSRALVEQALSFIGRRHNDPDCDPQQLEQALAQWRQQDTRHEQAYRLALQYWAQTDASDLRESVAKPVDAKVRRAGRRRALQVLCLAALAGGGGRWWWLQPVQRLSLATGQGQQILGQRLADGSVLDLAAATALEAVLYRDRREVNLAKGEARFAVARDESRPFRVTTPWGRVQVLGTVFSVAVRDNAMTVSVAEGRVAVWPSSAGAEDLAAAVLTAGQQAQIDRAGRLSLHEMNPASVGAWRAGWLVFDQTPLPEVLARWNDYLREPMRLARADTPEGRGLSDLRLTDSFPLRDPAAFLRSLPLMLPVRVDNQTVSAR